jgi:hypothetical protein
VWIALVAPVAPFYPVLQLNNLAYYFSLFESKAGNWGPGVAPCISATSATGATFLESVGAVSEVLHPNWFKLFGTIAAWRAGVCTNDNGLDAIRL